MSLPLKLDRADLISIGKSVILAAAGAALAYIAQSVLPNIDLGKGAWLIPVITVALNSARIWVAGQSK